MKKYILLAFLFLIFVNLAFTQTSDEKLVRACFEKYRTDLLNENGLAALEDVDTKTINYYSEMVELSQAADSLKIETLSLLDKMMVLMMRVKIPKEELLGMDGKALFVYAVNNEMIGKSSVANNTIGKVTVKQNFATGEFIANGRETRIYFEFNKEAGKWKLDLTSIFPITILTFDKLVEDSGKSENEFLLPLIEAATSKRVTAETWRPLK